MARDKLCVGIDIGASSVKLCQLRRVKRGFALEHFGLAPLPSEAIVDGAVMNASRVVDAIQELLATHGVRHKEVALSVSGHAVIIKKIALPQMTADELDESIQWEAEQFIPFDIQDVNIDVQIVRQQSTQAGQMDVLLVAAKKDLVNEYTSVIVEAGLTPLVCDVDAFAVENMFEANYDMPSDRSIALVNVGAAKTNINIISGGISSFTRDLSTGGNAFTEEIQKQLNVSFEEAEGMKIASGASSGDNTAASYVPEVDRAVQIVAESVTTEVQRSIDFYAATSAEAPPTHLYLTGGSARLMALQKALERRLGVEVAVADPFRNVEISPQERDYLRAIAPAAAVVVGLALRYPGDGV
ncbi:MAG: type IV pilus assembly protein PilM [Myxococcota bacterium]